MSEAGNEGEKVTEKFVNVQVRMVLVGGRVYASGVGTGVVLPESDWTPEMFAAAEALRSNHDPHTVRADDGVDWRLEWVDRHPNIYSERLRYHLWDDANTVLGFITDPTERAKIKTFVASVPPQEPIGEWRVTSTVGVIGHARVTEPDGTGRVFGASTEFRHPDTHIQADVRARIADLLGEQHVKAGPTYDSSDERADDSPARVRQETLPDAGVPGVQPGNHPGAVPSEAGAQCGAQEAAMRPVDQILADVARGVAKCRVKYPDPSGLFLGLTAEVGELANAYQRESQERVRSEAIDVCVCAVRIAMEGDPSLDFIREKSGLGCAPLDVVHQGDEPGIAPGHHWERMPNGGETLVADVQGDRRPCKLCHDVGWSQLFGEPRKPCLACKP